MLQAFWSWTKDRQVSYCFLSFDAAPFMLRHLEKYTIGGKVEIFPILKRGKKSAQAANGIPKMGALRNAGR
jgi:hypothetical protein